ncbi:MAG: N-acetylmuramoyl-L-alanine amidase [Oscillospiraceae bacterium]
MYKVVIDPGHGGKDFGALNGDRKEKDDNLRLSLLISYYLSKCNIEVIMTREDDRYVSLVDRANLANNEEADLFVSIHRNFAPPLIDGVEVWVSSKRPPNSIKLGNNILNQMLKSFPTDRGLNFGYPGQPNNDFAVNKLTKMSSALVEVGFITNSEDNIIFDNEKDTIAKNIAYAILDNLKVNCCIDGSGYLTVAEGVWNVRNEPNGDNIICYAYDGEEYIYTDFRDGFYFIGIGWISKKGVILGDCLLDDNNGTYISEIEAIVNQEVDKEKKISFNYEEYHKTNAKNNKEINKNNKEINKNNKENTDKTIKISDGVWNIREKPNHGDIIGVVYKDQVFPYKGKEEGWYKVKSGYITPMAVDKNKIVERNIIEIRAGKWNVRKKPKLDSEIVKVINGSQIIEFYDFTDNWYKVDGGFLNSKAVF